MYRTLENFVFKDKRVLVRVDFNVPLTEEGEISDDFRLKKAIPTLEYLRDNGASQIILMTHIGRPKGEVIESLKTNIVAKRIGEMLGEDVLKLDDCIDIEIPKEYKFVMLENLRFHSEEKENNDEFAKKLSSLADIFVLEAFSVSHRDDASVTGIQKHLPACIGILMQKEIESLDITHAKKPVVALFGAAKIADKITLLSKLLERVDNLLLGGGIVFTFFKAKGLEIGDSILDEGSVETAKKLLSNDKIILPDDIVVANEKTEKASSKTVFCSEIPAGWIGLDIGERSVQKYKEILRGAKTIIWNGPMGVFEIEKFAKATNELAEFISTLDATSIIGGGDTASAVRNLGLEDKFTHVSTGGGASLKMLEGEELAGIKALQENAEKFD